MVTIATKTDRILPAFSSDDEWWEALVRCDRTADGAFYYSVQTTGVYCRPRMAGVSAPAIAGVVPLCQRDGR
jgi:AraC family transcriptional regulator of adaptative response/methylated-DNA-[protein]-cysteine methyltransferase